MPKLTQNFEQPLHGVDSFGKVAFNKPLRRARLLPFFASLDPCLIGIEACATSHHWGRELSALGHNVKLMPPAYVKPYVKRGKSDAADAEAVCEAVTRPTMRFVEIKSENQQAMLCQHRAREIMVRQRTQLSNAIRGLIGEFGIILKKGAHYLRRFAQDVHRGQLPAIPEIGQAVILSLCEQLLSLHGRVKQMDKAIASQARTDPRIKLLQTIPGIGPINASAIVATIGSAQHFKSGRDFAAWIGLTPLNRSSGGKERLGKISRKGDRYLRKLLVVGMTARLRVAARKPDEVDPWTANILKQKPRRVATIAMANKTARIIWAVLTKNEPFKPQQFA